MDGAGAGQNYTLPPIVLDFATSELALGKVRETWARGEQTKDNVLLNPTGEPTNDPSVMFQQPAGSLLPFCGHKGYAMALMCEMIGGVLSGGNTIHPKYPRLMPRPVRRRFLKGANLHRPCIHLQWIQMGPFAIPLSFS